MEGRILVYNYDQNDDRYGLIVHNSYLNIDGMHWAPAVGM